MNVPIERSAFASTTADEAWDALSRMYCCARPHTASPEAALAVTSAETPAIAVDRVRLDAAEGAFGESPDQLNLVSVLSGRIRLAVDGHGAHAHVSGDSYLYPPDSPADLAWDTLGALVVRLPLDRVARSAAELTGRSPDALHFTSSRPVSAAHGQQWLRIATFLWQELSQPDGGAGHPLVHQELVNMAATTALTVFPNTAASTLAHRAAPGTLHAEPAVLRRAVEFIDANAHLPVSMGEIAAAARISGRTLQYAFRRHRDTTPLNYLRQVRMDRAHHDLHVADPTRDTVAAIAARWGFGNAGRFAVRYRDRYGRSPSTTLRS